MISRRKRVRAAFERAEDRATDLLYVAEQFSTTGASMHDLKVRRRSLLEAARSYARAMDYLTRVRRR
jgi:hypothetical protein